MTAAPSPRPRYRPSRRVDWKRFLPWALFTACLALALAAGMNWLFQRGWYWFIAVAFFAAAIAAGFISTAVGAGRCRFPAFGLLFGFSIGLLLYGGDFYFGMISLVGPEAITRLGRFPRYI